MFRPDCIERMILLPYFKVVVCHPKMVEIVKEISTEATIYATEEIPLMEYAASLDERATKEDLLELWRSERN